MIDQRKTAEWYNSINRSNKSPLLTVEAKSSKYGPSEDPGPAGVLSNIAFRRIGPVGKVFIYDECDEKVQSNLRKYGYWITETKLSIDELHEVFALAKEEMIKDAKDGLGVPTTLVWVILRLIEHYYEHKDKDVIPKLGIER